MLIANDVDVNATDASGMKAYDLAADYPAIQRALLLSGRLDAATKVTVKETEKRLPPRAFLAPLRHTHTYTHTANTHHPTERTHMSRDPPS
jgi:hypothetical protein